MESMKRAALGILAVLPLAVVTPGCETVKTPQEQAQIDAAEQAIGAIDDRLTGIEGEVKDLLATAKQALASGDAAAYASALERIEALSDEWDANLDARAESVQKIVDVEAAAAVRPVTLVGSLVDSFVPGGKLAGEIFESLGLVGAAGALLATRSRKHLFKGMKYAVKGQIGDLAKQLGRTAGWAHSTPATAALVESEESPATPPAA